jgi:hypothetical protein
MHGIAQNKLVFCEECGNALHAECFEQCSAFGWFFYPAASALTELCLCLQGVEAPPG